MSELSEKTVEVNGYKARVWTKGKGPVLGFLAGYGGLQNWTPFLDALAEKRTVVVPSLPGYPGAEGHQVLDNQLDWVVAVRQLLAKAGLEGADLAGSSVGASFAAEVAALWPKTVRRLALIAPWGLYDDSEAPADPWAQRGDQLPGLLCADPEAFVRTRQRPNDADQIDWMVAQSRALEAAARAFWPLGNTRIEKRLPLIEAQTLILWGAEDKVLPRSYARKFAQRIAAPSDVRIIDGAGHLADLDRPAETAAAILEWTA